jgi:phosphoglycerate dehydrogenase-like enzyme
MGYKTVFITERGHRHQQAARQAAPPVLDIAMLRQPDRTTLAAAVTEADYLISERAGAIDADLIRGAPHLKLILRLGSLTHDIDVNAAREAGVIVCSWPVGSVIRVAEHMVMQILALVKKLREVEAVALSASREWGESKRTDEDTFAYNWSRRDGIGGLWGRTVGILGFGEIGVELARRLVGWGVRLLYNKRRRLPAAVEQELGLTHVEVDALLAESDIVANLLPYFSNTDLSIGADAFARMKEGAWLVSCGSGSVIDEAALAEALHNGRLAGAALDTFEWEPLKDDNPLIALARAGYNVLLTPHTAAGVSSAAANERAQDYTNILAHIEGKPIRYRVV